MEDGDSDAILQITDTTPMSRLCSVIDNEDDDDGAKTDPAAQLDEMSKKLMTERLQGVGMTTRLDEMSQLSEASTNTDSTQRDDFDHGFLCALKSTGATCRDDASETPSINSAEYEHIASKIGLVDYAQELAFLPDRTELTPNTMDYTGENVICPHA